MKLLHLGAPGLESPVMLSDDGRCYDGVALEIDGLGTRSQTFAQAA